MPLRLSTVRYILSSCRQPNWALSLTFHFIGKNHQKFTLGTTLRAHTVPVTDEIEIGKPAKMTESRK